MTVPTRRTAYTADPLYADPNDDAENAEVAELLPQGWRWVDTTSDYGDDQ